MTANIFLKRAMKKIPDRIFNQFEQVAKRVILDLKNKGHIVPVQQSDGSLKFEKFLVTKNKNGLYSVTGKNTVYFDTINLPQTAALIANDLALGKIVDRDIVNLDRDYGFKYFEEQVDQNAKNRKKNSWDQVIFYETRGQTARVQKEALKNRIFKSFKKLTNII